MKKIVCFGEILLRLSPADFKRLIQSEQFEATYGGSEANVAVALSEYGKSTSFVTKLPDNEIGQTAVNSLRRYGVNTSNIVRGGERIGIYFYERGADPRPSRVIYDRAHSSISDAERSDFDWTKIMKDAEWFHFSGITPALSDNAAEITMDAVLAAKKAGATVSVDLNYRKKLWKIEKANKVMSNLVKHCDVVIGAIEDMKNTFDIAAGLEDEDDKNLINVMQSLMSQFDLKCIAVPMRKTINGGEISWHSVLYDGSNCYKSKNYTSRVVDRIGAGDAFGAGIIYGLGSGYDMKQTLEYATASSCLKHTIEGDFNNITVKEVEDFMAAGSSDNLER